MIDKRASFGEGSSSLRRPGLFPILRSTAIHSTNRSDTERDLSSKIKAVSFDLWDTLVIDDSDESKRQAQGLRSKPDERRHATWEALNREEAIAIETVTVAYNSVDAVFNKVWKELHVTWSVRERLDAILEGLGRTLPARELDALIDHHETMEVEIPPELIPGARKTLESLEGRYKICMISDSVVTPGRNLRKILAAYDLARFFDVFIFSDEAGHSKPHPSVFEKAAAALDVGLGEIVHVGDRQHNDIAGPKALGLKAILFTASRATDVDGNTADAVCESHESLPRIIDDLAG